MTSRRAYSIHQINTEEEYQLCLQIRKKVFIEEQKVPTELEIDSYETSGQNFLLFWNGEPVATGRYRIQNGLAKFERVAVLLEMRRKGLGKFLMETLQVDCKKRFPRHLQAMHAQVDSIPFYEKLGWFAIGDVFIDANIEHRWMIFPPKKEHISKLYCLKDPQTPTAILSFLLEFSG